MVARKDCIKEAALVTSTKRGNVSENIAQNTSSCVSIINEIILVIYVFSKPQEESQDDTKDNDTIEPSIDLIHLRIITSRLGIVNLNVSYFDSGLQLKEKVVKKLEASLSPSSSFSDDIHNYKLIRSRTKKPFRDYDSILGLNVTNHEEFLMLTKRPGGAIDNLMKVHSRGPTEKEILSKTRNLPLIRSSNCTTLNMSMDTAFFQGDLQHDLRKILSEIAKYSAYILGSLPFGEKLIKYYRQKIIMSLYNHQDIVKLLVDMGFSRENVLRALKLHGNNYTLALDWLVENVSKSSIEPIESTELSTESIDDLTESTYRRLCRKTFPSTSSIFYPKHKAIVSFDRRNFYFYCFFLLIRIMIFFPFFAVSNLCVEKTHLKLISSFPSFYRVLKKKSKDY